MNIPSDSPAILILVRFYCSIYETSFLTVNCFWSFHFLDLLGLQAEPQHSAPALDTHTGTHLKQADNMGSTSSKESAKDSHKLSKPKTKSITAPSNLPPATSKTDISASAIATFLETEADDMVITAPDGHSISRQDTRRYLRSRIFGTKPDGSELDSYDDQHLGALPADVKDPYASLPRSRRGNVQQSPATRDSPVGDSQLSLVTDGRAIDLEAAIAIIQELKKTASPEDLIALRMLSL